MATNYVEVRFKQWFCRMSLWNQTDFAAHDVLLEHQ